MFLTALIFSIFLCVALIIIITRHLKNKRQPKLYGYYSMGGQYFWLKKRIMYMILLYRKLKNRQPKTIWNNEELNEFQQSEQIYQFPKDESFAIDSVYFFGGDRNRTKPSFILRLARRPDRTAELWFIIRMPNGEVLQHLLAPETHICNTEGNSFSAGGVRITCDEPMISWKIVYHGLMRKGLNKDSDAYSNVNISLRFRSSVHPFDAKKDLSSKLVAEFVAREPWTRFFFDKLKRNDDQVHIEQWGSITGNISIDDEDTIVNLLGYRDHSYGTRDWRQFYRYASHFGYTEDGSFFSFGSVCIPKITSHVKYGYLYLPYGEKCPIDYHNYNLWEHGELSEPPKQYEVKFITNQKDYTITVAAEDTIQFFVQNQDMIIYERFTEFKINGMKAWGVSEYCYQNNSFHNAFKEESVPCLLPQPCEKNQLDSMIINLDNNLCRYAHIVGGKGAQLGQLTFGSKILGLKYTVPKGFVVATAAFREFINDDEQLKNKISDLQKECRSQTAGEKDEVTANKIETLTKEIQKMITDKELSDHLSNTITTSIDDMFKTGERLAVRSSCISEDGSDSSSAGQMETFLGTKHISVVDKIKQCWSSLYHYRAVEYRHNNGMPIDSEMAVVIQEMVNAKTAGVMFTIHPETFNNNEIVINSNYGLGESVVSGKVTPDTYTVTKGPKGLQITEKIIGEKSEIMKMSDSGDGIEEMETDENDKSSLDDSEIISLSEIGLSLEKHYGSPRDIEFAIAHDKIFLLQARPVTAVEQESIEELLHEFDSPVTYDDEWLTTCNIGEMTPGAVTPLTLSVFARIVDRVLKFYSYSNGTLSNLHCNTSFLKTYCNHMMINITGLGLNTEMTGHPGGLDFIGVVLCGRVLQEPTQNQIKRFAAKDFSFTTKLYNTAIDFYLRYYSTTYTKDWEKKFEDGYLIRPRFTAKEQFVELSDKLPDCAKCWLDTVMNSSNSAVNSMVIMSIFSKHLGWTEGAFGNLTLVLSDCENVYSADVPSALQEVAESILQSPELNKFMSQSPEEGANWLLSVNSGIAGERFRKFMYQHGFRCIREAEFREVSWNRETSKVVKTIQATIASKSHKKQAKELLSPEEVMTKLTEIKLNFFEKWLIKKLIPSARRGVGLREWGKAISIRMVDAFKEGYLNLASLMVDEGLIPDKDLVFFFTHRELGMVINQIDSSKLVNRARRRRQILPKQHEGELPELIHGEPKFISETEDEAIQTTNSENFYKGMPVSRGEVTATIRVIQSLQDAQSIQRGEILIVPYTDVGWTPYFPMISGLVTEKGGLLSHGAVVAREYGIPCVVGLRNATKLFSTGQKVRLNGIKGTVEVFGS